MNKRLAKLIVTPLWGGVALICFINVTKAHSADINWNNPSGGNFEDTANWDGGVVPISTDVARFNLVDTYSVDMNVNTNNQRLQVFQGDVTLNLNNNTYSLNANSQVNTNGILNLQNGVLQTDENVSGFGVAIDVGGAGTGTLNLSNNGILRTIDGSSLRIGDSPTGNGTVNVLDSTAQIETDGALLVSVVGQAELNILNGGVVNTNGNAEMAVGFFGGSPQGTATINGIGSQWNINGSLVMGGGTTNLNTISTLNVENGGSVTATSIISTNNNSTISGDGSIETTGSSFLPFGFISVGSISPGSSSIGNLTIETSSSDGSLLGGEINFEIAGTSSNLYDQLLMTGDVTDANSFGGGSGDLSFNLLFDNGFTPTVGDEFLELITFDGSFLGNLDNIQLTSNNDNFIYETVLSSNSLGVRVAGVSTPEPTTLFSLGLVGLGLGLSRKKQQ